MSKTRSNIDRSESSNSELKSESSDEHLLGMLADETVSVFFTEKKLRDKLSNR